MFALNLRARKLDHSNRNILAFSKRTAAFPILPLLVAAILAVSSASAQNGGDYVAGINYPAGPPTAPTNTNYWVGGISPEQVFTGYFTVNGTSQLGIVTAAACGPWFLACPASGSAIAVYISYGNGAFSNPILTSGNLPPSLRSIAVGDFNGDGNVDVVAAADCLSDQDCSSGTITIFLGNGDGTFSQASQYQLNGIVGNAGTLAVGDFNRDGKLDLAVGLECYGIPVNCGSGAVDIYLGNGDGTLSSPTSYATVGNSPLFPVVGDFNNDGRPDVIAGSGIAPGDYYHSSLTVLLGQGNGTFTESVMPLTLSGLNGFVSADFNSDGDLDLAIETYFSADVLFGNGDGTFQPPATYSVGTYSTSIVAADVNGDGKTDLAVAGGASGYGSNFANLLINNGTGAFQISPTYLLGGWESASLAVADFNSDGKADLLLASFCAQTSLAAGELCPDGTISFLAGNGDGTMQGATILNQTVAPLASVTADVNGDGIPDLIETDETDQGEILVYLGTGNGQYAPPVAYDAGVSPGNAIVTGDFNGDGRIDVAVATNCFDSTCTQGAASVLLGNGDGTFQPHATYASGGQGAVWLATGDFDGDGRLDIALANQSGSVAVLLGNGDGTFKPSVVNSAGSVNLSIAAADFNGDGKTDVALDYISGNAGGFIQILFGGANGILTPVGEPYPSGGNGGQVQTGISGGALSIADVNRDGNLDIVIANQCQYADSGCSFGSLAVFLGNGDGTFTGGALQTLPDANLYSLFLADVNGDGILDAVATNLSGVAVFHGNGDGTFSTPTVYAGVANASVNTSLALADLNIIQPGAGTGSTAVLVNRKGSYMITTSSANPSEGHPTITLTTMISPSYLQNVTPTGSVTYYEGTNNLGSSSITEGSAPLTISGLSQGVHTILPFYSGDGNFNSHFGTPILQVISSGLTQTITFTTPAPPTAKSGDRFTVAATGGASGNSVVFSVGSGSMCTLSGTTYTMTSDTGYCYVVANQSGNLIYSPANTVTETVTAVKRVTKITPTVSFTGAPASTTYLNNFLVYTAQNSGVTPKITSTTPSVCSVTSGIVTMKSGTGTCTMKASWAANDYYLATSLEQSTASTLLGTITNITSTVPNSRNGLKVEVYFGVSNGTDVAVKGNVTVAAASGETCTAPVTPGKCLLTFTSAESTTLTATYEGNNDNASSTSSPYPLNVH